MHLLLLTTALAGAPEQLADDAVAANPSLAAMEARAAGLGELAGVADLWPDPMVGVEYSNMAVDAPLPGNHPMSGVQLKATQVLPTPGVTGLRADVAQGQVAMQLAAIDASELELRKQVVQTWWRLALTRELRSVTQQHVERTSELLEAVRARYEVGQAGQSALLRLELLRDRLNDDLGDYDRAERELTAALSRAVSEDRTFQTDLPVTPLAVEGDVVSWLERASDHPTLVQLDLAAGTAEDAARLAVVDARPDLSLWAGYRVRTQEMDGTDLVSVGLGMPVPLRSRQKGQGTAAAHQASADAARAQHQATLDMLAAQLETTHARWTRAADKAATYGDVLIPAAEATLETTLSDFRVGKADFSQLYEAETALLTLERMRLVAAAETRIQHAEMLALTGGTP